MIRFETSLGDIDIELARERVRDVRNVARRVQMHDEIASDHLHSEECSVEAHVSRATLIDEHLRDAPAWERSRWERERYVCPIPP